MPDPVFTLLRPELAMLRSSSDARDVEIAEYLIGALSKDSNSRAGSTCAAIHSRMNAGLCLRCGGCLAAWGSAHDLAYSLR